MDTPKTFGGATNHGRPGIFELIRGILEDGKTLLAKELLAAKLEIREEIAKTRQATILLAAGFFIFAIGVIMLSLMAAFLLDRYSVLPLWASFGAVGVIYVIAAGILFATGKRKVAEIDAFPRDSIKEAKEDVRYIKQAIRR
jgi:hypothetical protein